MNATIIIVTLFVILCPCISYIKIKKSLIPWSGGVFLYMEDGTHLPIQWEELDWYLPESAKVKGIFLAGARKYMMPSVYFRLVPDRGGREELEKNNYYRIVETENGVYIIYCQPIDNTQYNSVILDVDAPYSWKTHYRCANDPHHYYDFVIIHFGKI